MSISGNGRHARTAASGSGYRGIVRYVIRERLLSLFDTYTVQDDQGRPALEIRGKLSWSGEDVAFVDGAGVEQARLRRRVFALTPTFELTQGERVVARIEKEMSFFSCRFLVDGPGDYDLDIQGNFTDREYEVWRSGRLIARVSKRLGTVTDHYGIETARGEQDLLIVAAAIAIDRACHD